jgi:hypothetical protein
MEESRQEWHGHLSELKAFFLTVYYRFATKTLEGILMEYTQEEWDRDGARSATRAERPRMFIQQQIAPLLYESTTSVISVGRGTTFLDDQAFWTYFHESQDQGRSLFDTITLKGGFAVSDWFPRAPGMYWSRAAAKARENVNSNRQEHDPDLGGKVFAARARPSVRPSVCVEANSNCYDVTELCPTICSWKHGVHS